MFKGTKKVDHILESSTDVQSFLRHLSFINYRLLKKRYSSRLKIPMFIGTPCFKKFKFVYLILLEKSNNVFFHFCALKMTNVQ